jgi:hypothetical protein
VEISWNTATCETTSRWENGINLGGGGIKENLLNLVSIAGIYFVANFRVLIPKNYAVNMLVCRLAQLYNLIQFSNLRLRCLLQIAAKYALDQTSTSICDTFLVLQTHVGKKR